MLAGTSANRATCPLKWRKRLGCVLGVSLDGGTRRLVPGFAYGPRESALAFAQELGAESGVRVEQDAKPTAEASDRGPYPGFPLFNVLAGGPGSLAERSATTREP